MSFIPSQFSLQDGPQLDAGGRLRTSLPSALFSSMQEYTSAPLLAENYTAGTATATYTQAYSSTLLSTFANTAGNRVVRQSKAYWRYQPGFSQLVKMTGVLAYSGTPTGTAVARIGYYDDNNGLFFGRNATGYHVCIRTDTSGSVSDANLTYQSAWNLDKMDGTGPSGVTIDFTKEQYFVIDFLWHGIGRVRWGFQQNGIIYYVHQYVAANVLATPYMRTPNLPVRYEVYNVGGTGSVVALLAGCPSVSSEGGESFPPEYSFNVGTKGVTSASLPNTATLTPLFSIRLVDTFGGKTYRGHIHPSSINLLTKTNDIYWELIYNATLTGATWANSVDATYSGVEYDLAATALTGGVAISSGYGAAGQGSSSNLVTNNVNTNIILARTYANVRDTLTLAARGIGGAATCFADINYTEQY